MALRTARFIRLSTKTSAAFSKASMAAVMVSASLPARARSRSSRAASMA